MSKKLVPAEAAALEGRARASELLGEDLDESYELAESWTVGAFRGSLGRVLVLGGLAAGLAGVALEGTELSAALPLLIPALALGAWLVFVAAALGVRDQIVGLPRDPSIPERLAELLLSLPGFLAQLVPVFWVWIAYLFLPRLVLERVGWVLSLVIALLPLQLCLGANEWVLARRRALPSLGVAWWRLLAGGFWRPGPASAPGPLRFLARSFWMGLLTAWFLGVMFQLAFEPVRRIPLGPNPLVFRALLGFVLALAVPVLARAGLAIASHQALRLAAEGLAPGDLGLEDSQDEAGQVEGPQDAPRLE